MVSFGKMLKNEMENSDFIKKNSLTHNFAVLEPI